MYKLAKPLFLICETPMHAGSGDDLGVVDLPIQRERHTSFPKIEASSLKGALREAFEHLYNSKNADFKVLNSEPVNIHKAFGFDDGSLSNSQKEELKKHFKDDKGNFATEFAGALGFSDARLLLFPVKSMKGVFAWVTCKKVLLQFERDMKLTDASFAIENLVNLEHTKHYNNSVALKIGDNVVLEEYAFKVKTHDLKVGEASLGDYFAITFFDKAEMSFWQNKIKTDIVILADDDFKDFVNLSTEVITRTKINNETGTVQNGALFTEEFLPAESVMYSLVLASNVFGKKPSDDFKTAEQVLDFFNKIPEVVQIGGNATLGKGITRTKFLNPKTEGGAK